MRHVPWSLVLVGGLLLGAVAGCTPKPNQQQLQELDRACPAADEAERAVETARRQLNDVERLLATKRQALGERQRYLNDVRANLQSTQ
jgi:hypothetical protein